MVSCNFQKFCENKQERENLILEQFNDICFQIAATDDTVESFFQEVVLPILEAGKVFNGEQLMSAICEDAVDRYLQKYGTGKQDLYDRATNFVQQIPGAAKTAYDVGKKVYDFGKRGVDAAKNIYNSMTSQNQVSPDVLGPAGAPEPEQNYSPEQQQAMQMLNKRLPDVKRSFIKHIDKITKDVMDDAISLAGSNKMGGRVSWIAARSLGNQLKNAIQNWNPKTTFSGGPTGFSAALQQSQGDKANMTRRLAQMDQPAGYDARKDPANVFGPKASSAPAAKPPMSTPAVPSTPAQMPSDAGRKSPLFVPRSRTDMTGRPAVKGQDFMRR